MTGGWYAGFDAVAVFGELTDRLGANGLPGGRLLRALAKVRQRARAGIVDRHRSHVHVGDTTKGPKACGAERLPRKGYARTSAWLQVVTLVVSRKGTACPLSEAQYRALAETARRFHD